MLFSLLPFRRRRRQRTVRQRNFLFSSSFLTVDGSLCSRPRVEESPEYTRRSSKKTSSLALCSLGSYFHSFSLLLSRSFRLFLVFPLQDPYFLSLWFGNLFLSSNRPLTRLKRRSLDNPRHQHSGTRKEVLPKRGKKERRSCVLFGRERRGK